jgi:hypothetical protein
VTGAGDLVFLGATAALQVGVAVSLALRRVAWCRLLAALFGLNALLTLNGVGLSLGMAGVALDGATGAIILAFALAYPRPHARLGAFSGALLAWMGLAVFARAIGLLNASWFALLAQDVPVSLGYAAFLVRVAIPFLRDPSKYGQGGAWIVGGFSIRMIEFPLRYARLSDLAGWTAAATWGTLAHVLLAAAGVATFVAFAAALRRGGEVRAELALVAGCLAAGVVLGMDRTLLGDASPEPLRRFSLVLIRPVFVVVGVWGMERLRPSFQLTAAPAGRPPRWRDALVALERAARAPGEELETRSGLATALGIDPRNVHRVVVEANRRARDELGAADDVVTWRVARGRGNQRKYFYALTPEGARLVASLSTAPYEGGVKGLAF